MILNQKEGFHKLSFLYVKIKTPRFFHLSVVKVKIISLRTVAALRKYAGGIFLAQTAVAMPRGPTVKQEKRNTQMFPSECCKSKNYLFENCGARRAALRPYFFLSFIRGSRVRNPAFLRAGRSDSSY